MRDVLRRLLNIRVGITPAQAIRIARIETERRGLKFREPVACIERLRFSITANPCAHFGEAIIIRVSVVDGAVLGFRHHL